MFDLKCFYFMYQKKILNKRKGDKFFYGFFKKLVYLKYYLSKRNYKNLKFMFGNVLILYE